MDTKAIEEYSKWARRELIERVGDRLYALGLSEKNRIPYTQFDCLIGFRIRVGYDVQPNQFFRELTLLRLQVDARQ